MAEKKIICITCPQGCIITVEGDAASGRIDSVKGFSCPRGKKYAESEFVHPVRILTSSVRSDIRPDCPLPVRTAGPIPKELLFEGMEEIRKTGMDLLAVLPQDDTIYEFDGEGKPTSQLPEDNAFRKALYAALDQLTF